MNRIRLAAKCRYFIGRIKERRGALIDDHALELAGKRDQLVARVQELRGLATEHAERQLKDFLYRNRNWQRPLG